MNAAIRAVVRTGLGSGLTVWGVYQGYSGLIEGSFKKLGARDVGSIIQRGGTILGSARCMEFQTEEGRELAIRRMKGAGIEGLVVIGGNGSQTGANALHQMGFPVVGVASTIDNDLYGSDITIGVDTALNIALDALDNLKVTASSHRRALLVEVMGRKCGYLALMAGIAGGAEAIVLPEIEVIPSNWPSAFRTDTNAASHTPSSWWPRALSTTPKPCASILKSTICCWVTSSVRRCSATCSAAACPPARTACSVRGWAPKPWNR